MPIKDAEMRRLAHREYMRTTWYPANRKKHQALVHTRDRRYKTRVQLILDELRAIPCADCGNTFPPICMDFDHVRGKKISDVSRLVMGAFSLKVIMTEIEKCEVVCSNCHRIRTCRRTYKHRSGDEGFRR